MKKTQKKIIPILAQRIGLCMDEESGVLYGQREGFQILLGRGEEHPYPVAAIFSAARSTGSLTRNECKELAKQHKEICSVSQEQNSITVQLRVS